MELKLNRPLVFFDIEATGLDVVNDRIVEIAILKVHPNGKEEKQTFRMNPEIEISQEAIEIHGISNDDVKDSPKFADLAKEILAYFQGSDIAGYNSTKFDVPLLAEEFLRADIDFNFKKSKLIDAQVIFFKKEQRTLAAAYEFYCGKELVDAHGAEADTHATFEVLKGQLDRYPDLQNDINKLAEISMQNNNADFAGRIIYNDKGVECFNFGKHKGTSVAEVLVKEPGFYKWMMYGDFPRYTKKVLTAIKLREAFGSKISFK